MEDESAFYDGVWAGIEMRPSAHEQLWSGIESGTAPARSPPSEPKYPSFGGGGLTDQVSRSVYEYWASGGMAAVMANKLYGCVVMAATAIWSFVLLVGIDWGALVGPDPVLVVRVSEVFANPTPLEGMVILYTVSGCCASAFMALDAAMSAGKLTKTRSYLKCTMGIGSDRDLAAMSWEEMATGLHEALRKTSWDPATNIPGHSFHRDIAARITRASDVVTLLDDSGVLLQVTGWIPLSSLAVQIVSLLAVHPLFGGPADAPSPSMIASDPAGIRKRAAWAFAACLLLLPFIVLWVLVRTVARFAEEMHAGAGYSRVPTEATRQATREYLELPHALGLRCAAMGPAVKRYLDQMPVPALSKAAATASYLAVLPLIMLVIVGFAQEDVLSTSVVAGKNLIWWGASLGGVVALARSMRGEGAGAATAGKPSDPEKHRKVLESVARGISVRGIGDATGIAPMRAVGRLRSILASLMVPVLCVRIWRRADRIAHVLNRGVVVVPRLGPVAQGSTLDPDAVDRTIGCKVNRVTRSAISWRSKGDVHSLDGSVEDQISRLMEVADRRRAPVFSRPSLAESMVIGVSDPRSIFQGMGWNG